MVHLRTGVKLDRKDAKILNFLMIYGGGYSKVAEQLGVTLEQATVVRDAYLEALPGVRDLQVESRNRFRRGYSIRTIGGRVYKVEPPKGGRSFDYKALNILIQGGAADQTKRAICLFCAGAADGYLLGSVYDEINISAPADTPHALANARILARSMEEAVKLDVGTGVDIEIGPNWGTLTEMELT
jgi:DNA polymerase-1